MLNGLFVQWLIVGKLSVSLPLEMVDKYHAFCSLNYWIQKTTALDNTAPKPTRLVKGAMYSYYSAR